ncbi:hypothetical protein Goshw_002397 [Gossypium schwendimanii]|uniref:Uncharacterized protein n=1 Tax=Gossypium schwendimanii TaxID=34291 RepID=A0A7J9MFV0_GOSSC|nr:hypothetical protein [Gossypium schwendimanii]
MFMGKLPLMIKHGHVLWVHSLLNVLKMSTVTCLKRMRKRM